MDQSESAGGSVTAVAAKLQIKTDSVVLCLPGEPQLGMVGPLPAVTTDPAAADVALIAITDPEEVDELMAGLGEQLSALRALWLVYPKGGAALVNRDTLWAQLVGHDWRLVSAVAVDERWTAVRARPLQPGEAATVPG